MMSLGIMLVMMRIKSVCDHIYFRSSHIHTRDLVPKNIVMILVMIVPMIDCKYDWFYENDYD